MNFKNRPLIINIFVIATVIFSLAILPYCSRRMDIKREWPMPLKINPGIIKQCNMIHNRICPDKSGEMINATYIFDKRNLSSIEEELKKSEPDILKDSGYEKLLLTKIIESASAYSATFIRSECSIEYYIKGKNVTCEAFLSYVDDLKKECEKCIEVIKVGPENNPARYNENSIEGLFYE